MLTKILVVIVGAIAYVFGAKAGHERYEQIRDQAMRLWRDPRVREKASEAADVVKDKAPEAKDRLADGARQAAEKVKPNHSDEEPTGGNDSAVGNAGAER